MKKIAVLFFFPIIIIFSFQLYVYGDLYWVSPNGTASWQTAKSKQSISGTACASIITANANVKAGDTIIMRGGNYNTGISPANSGSSANSMIVIKAHTGETPWISGSDGKGTFMGIHISGLHYIKIDAVLIKDCDRWMLIRNNSSHIEISNCEFMEPDKVNASPIFICGWAGGGQNCDQPCSNIWFHDNIVHDDGHVNPSDCDDFGALMYIGSTCAGDSNTNYNTIENNTFYHGGHHLWESYTKFNVFRNNIHYNEGFMDTSENCLFGPSVRNNKYGNRCIQLMDMYGYDGMYNLLERNRFGYSAFASDGCMDGNITITAPKNIIRYNYSFYSEAFGIYFKLAVSGLSNGRHNRVYNNTFYYNGQNSRAYTAEEMGGAPMDWRYSLGFHTMGKCTSNVIKNCIYYQGYSGDIYGGDPTKNTYSDNWFTTNGDPLFVDTNITDPFNDTLPNLSLKWGSPCIDRGFHLTNARGSGDNSTKLTVLDALYFQDGTWGSSLASLEPDWIAVGSIKNVVQIKSIDYTSNIITLASPLTWSENAKVWLYKDSAGRIVLKGTNTDMGADESDNYIGPPKEFYAIP